MSGTLSFDCKAQLPPEGSAAECARLFGASITFAQKAELELVYDSPVVDSAVGLGTITDAKAVLIKGLTGKAVVKLNAGDAGTEIPAGGFLAWANSDGGVPEILVTTTAPATLYVLVVA